jgi:hypothetical protein
MARYPNAFNGKNIFDTWNLGEQSDTTMNPLDKRRIAKWKNPKGAYLHAMHEALWGDMHWIVKGKNSDGSLLLEGGWQNNRPANMHPVYRMIENVFEELDTTNEWYFDRDKGVIYLFPDKDTNIRTAIVEIVELDNLITVKGSIAQPVHDIHFQGFVFRHAARTFMQNKEPLLRSDWTTYRGGSITFEGAENCSVEDCEFDQVGGNTIAINNYNKDLLFKGLYIHDSGANGLVFVGSPHAVRSPLFRYGPQNYATMDRTPGPKNNNFPRDCRVEDCIITRTGRYEKQTAPVQISMSYHITVNHCSIYDVPRAGINISEGTFGGHVIEYCDIFNTVLETGDHGSFNSWGRDRYWSPDCRMTEQEVKKDTILPHLDIISPIIIRNSRWRCDHGWDIDLDDASSYYHIYNNVLLNGGLKLREGYGRVVTNNIILNNSLHPHVWYSNSGDVVERNIFFKAYQSVGMNLCIPNNGKWGERIDDNYFISKEDKDKFRDNGCDIHSMSGVPMFRDADKGDYRVREDSPALKVGFKNFSMNFGVVSPRLKKIVKKPQLPILKMNDLSSKANNLIWEGMTLKDIETIGEQSAVGLKDSCGLLVLNVDHSSPWASLIHTNDVLLEYQGRKICSINELKAMDIKLKKQSVKVWRNQQELTLNIVIR